MTYIGEIFIGIGAMVWLIGARWLINRVLKRCGITRRSFPFALYSIPFKKFNRQEWFLLVAILLASALLFSIGRLLMIGI